MAAINPITKFKSKTGRYPGNNKQWWVARADTDDPDKNIKAGDFLPEVLDKLFYGNNQAPRGHYVLHAFYKDRAGVSGVSGIPVDVVEARPNSIAFYAGRAWFGCNSDVYFSQLLTDRHKAGNCYQEADPTSEHISDLIPTDGGVIPIPEISKIVRLLPSGDGVVVLATNGVWNISGGQGGFSATDISVSKISPVGCKNPMSIVETEQGVFWWSDVGIMGMQEKLGMYGPIPGAFDRTNISENTIQTFYNDIPENVKEEVKGVFDARNGRVMWLYRDDDVSETQYNRVLIFDLALNAFYPWKVSNLEGVTPYIKGIFVAERKNTATGFTDVDAEGLGDVLADGENVVVGLDDISSYPSSIEFITMHHDQGRFAQFNNASFVDWKTANGVGAPYESYVETGYELFDDAMRSKNITYLFTYLKTTEQSWNETDGLDDPSSCYLTVKWDWANSGVSNKWTTPVQVYRPGRFLPMTSPTYDTGFPVTVTKSKIRGNGKSIQFRYGTNEPGRNFDLHGWSVAVTGKTVP